MSTDEGQKSIICGAKCPGKPFACQLPKGHKDEHEDFSVNVGGRGWTWDD